MEDFCTQRFGVKNLMYRASMMKEKRVGNCELGGEDANELSNFAVFVMF